MSLGKDSILHDRYRIEGQLGKGGMGTVYLAFDQTLQIRVAVKENMNPNPESERQFRREATLLASLRHPNLPRVTDHFILEGRQYLVMDFIEGVDLHTRAAHQDPTLQEVLAWGLDASDALAYLHTRQPPIIHRDIKPANLKLQPDGKVVLVDFGIAKIFDQAQTTTGARGLTPGYSPPEQYGGSRTDQRSDQYSLAATIYSLLTKQAPVDSIERMLNKEELVPARRHLPDLPAYVDAALTRALALDQDDRFPDIQSFKAALQGKLVAPTVRKKLPKGAARAGPSRLPIALFAGLGGLGVLLLGGGAILALGRGNLGLSSAATTSTPSPQASLAVVVTEPPTQPVASTTPEPSATDLPPATPTQGTLLGGGGRIAFVSNRAEGILQIWTMNPDGSNPEQITFGPGNKTEPRWSPNGRRLLFVADGGQDRFGTALDLDVWIMNADGSHATNLTQSPGDDTNPAWDPHGNQIALTSTRSGNVRLVFLMNVACPALDQDCTAEAPRRITMTGTFAVEYSPAWSPDGGLLAVVASINGARGRIYFGGPGGNGSAFDRSDRLIGVDNLRWPPAGFLFSWRVSSGQNEIYTVPVDSPRTPTQLTNSLGNKEPTISWDGQWIAFTSTRDQNPEIYLMTATGSDQHNLSNDQGQDIQPDWQPPLSE
jgi:Tol biopolymer transport system component/serine/threonine protein kinase